MAKSAGIAKLSGKHEAIMLTLLKHPDMRMGDVAKRHKVTQAWLSTIVHSNAFQHRLAEIKQHYFGEAVLSIAERTTAVTMLALERLATEVEGCNDGEFLLEVVDKGTKILGLQQGEGPQPGTVAVQNNVVYVANAEDLAKAREAMRNISEPEVKGEVVGEEI